MTHVSNDKCCPVMKMFVDIYIQTYKPKQFFTSMQTLFIKKIIQSYTNKILDITTAVFKCGPN